MRPDHLGIYDYERDTSPNIDKWFSSGTVFERAYSAEASTSPSVVSFLTGLMPQHHRARFLYQKIDPNLNTISKILKNKGYQTCGVIANTVLTSEASDLDTQFEYYDDFIDEKEPYRPNYERGARAKYRCSAQMAPCI